MCIYYHSLCVIEKALEYLVTHTCTDLFMDYANSCRKKNESVSKFTNSENELRLNFLEETSTGSTSESYLLLQMVNSLN